MRVIAGSAGGIQLEVPKCGVRPTMDRVKAAIFSSLANKVIGARVLDLFAGSGALGIEALSRGAATVLFVDEGRRAMETIQRNLAKTRSEAETRQQEVFEFLRRAISLGKFDIIFADPPYQQTKQGERFTDKLLVNESLPLLLEQDGVFILEKRPGETIPESPVWKLVHRRKYGATEVLFFSVNPQSAIATPQ